MTRSNNSQSEELLSMTTKLRSMRDFQLYRNAELEDEIAELRESNRQMMQVIENKQGIIDNQKQIIKQKDARLEAEVARVNSVLNSFSWKITKPVRGILRFLK